VTPSEDPQERSATAGEYVLGTLDAAARAEFERALADDPALQAEVYAWQDRLLGLARRNAPAEPDAGLWPAIEARLDAPRAATAPLRNTGNTSAANDALWRRLRRWQIGGALAMAASLLLAALLVLRAPGTEGGAPTRYLAVLQAPDDKATGWVVEITAGDKLRLVPVGASAPVPAGKALQFWTKPEGAAGPTSLGLVRAGQVTELPVSRLPAVEAQTLFELTLEPEGGSTIGRPTGPILYVGRTVAL
jgi:anti-sigma-K factor RskA